MTLLTGNGSMDFEGLADLQWIGITIRWIVNGWMCWQIGMGLGDNDRIDMQLADWHLIGDRLRSTLGWLWQLGWIGVCLTPDWYWIGIRLGWIGIRVRWIGA